MKLTAAQKQLSKVNKSGIKSISSFFTRSASSASKSWCADCRICWRCCYSLSTLDMGAFENFSCESVGYFVKCFGRPAFQSFHEGRWKRGVSSCSSSSSFSLLRTDKTQLANCCVRTAPRNWKKLPKYFCHSRIIFFTHLVTSCKMTLKRVCGNCRASETSCLQIVLWIFI